MKFQRKRRQSVDITLISMIDVLFVLLLFFMVSTTFNRNTEVSIKLPQADGAVVENPPKILTLTIDATGNYTLIGEDNVARPVADQTVATLKQALHNVAMNKTDTPFIINADAKTPHQAVITALEAAGNEGFTHITFAAQKTAESP